MNGKAQVGWLTIVNVYLIGLVGTASLGLVGPLAGDISSRFNVTQSEVGLAIAGQLLPLAFAGVIMGWIIDKVGARTMLGIGLFVLAICSYTNSLAENFFILRGSFILQGVALVSLLTAGQSFIMSTLRARRRTQALTLWSTVMPVGYGVGMFLCSIFAGRQNWQDCFLLHAVTAIILLLTCIMLPKSSANVTGKKPSSLYVMRDAKVLRLGMSLSLAALAGAGSNAIGTLYLSKVHGFELSLAAQVMAAASFAGILGSFIVGMLLTRVSSAQRVATLLVIVALIGGTGFYVPFGIPVIACVGAVLQQIAVGGVIALVFSSLPQVLPDPRMAATTAGLVGQITGIGATVSAPLFFFALDYGCWAGFLLIISVAWIASFLVLPKLTSNIHATAPYAS